MPKISLLVLIVAIVIIVAGCRPSGPGPGPSPGDRFIGGTQGLAMDFFEGAPPDESYDGGGNTFGIVLRVENKGEDSVEPSEATFRLSGFLPSEFNVTPAEMRANLTERLQGRDLDPNNNERPGGITQIEFGNNNFDYVGQLSGNTPFTIQASACYLYKTKASASLCVESDLLDFESSGSVCEANENKNLQVSGAPLQFESTLQESVAGSNKVSFTFNIRKVKVTSEIFSPNTPEGPDGTNCIDENQYEDWVRVRVDTGLSGNLRCTSLANTGPGHADGSIKLFSGSRQVVCTQTLEQSDMGDYETEVQINLDYYFKDYKRTDILIRHLPNDNGDP